MLRMNIEGVGFDRHRQTVVVLKDWDGRKILPIWIDSNQARSIALAMEGVSLPRPLSHDLLLTCIALRRGRVTRVVINDLQESTFYATIDIDTPKGIRHIDARPSDAIAVAVRAKCPVFVDGGAIDALVEVSESSPTISPAIADPDNEDMESWLGQVSPPNAPPDDDEMDRFKRLIGEMDL